MNKDINKTIIFQLQVFLNILSAFLKTTIKYQECLCKQISFGSVDQILLRGSSYDDMCAVNMSSFTTASTEMVSFIFVSEY